MIDRLILTKRLSLIKYLYQQGVEQSKKPESIAGFSILSFQDSIEMFLRLLVEYKGRKESANFMAHWSDYPDLILVESIRRLNNLRVNFKHKGLMPSKDDIEACKVYTKDFLYQSSEHFFGIEFNNVSLIDLISYDSIKESLKMSESCLLKNELTESLVNSAIAFKKLIDIFDSTKRSESFEQLLPIDKKVDLTEGMSGYFGNHRDNTLRNDLERLNKNIKIVGSNVLKELDNLKYQFKLVSLGIDYVKYSKFILLTPDIYRQSTTGKYVAYDRERNYMVKVDEYQCQFCIDFVIESTLILSNVDQDLKSLKQSRQCEN